MSESAVTITVKLDDESKALLKGVASALAKSDKTATAAKPKTKAAPKDEDADDAADDLDFDADADEADADEADADEGGDGEEAEVTRDDVGEAMRAYATAPGGAKALAMAALKKFGKTDKLTDLKPANFAAVIEACNAAAKKLKAAAKKK